jgi:hypothetical protein
VLETGFDQKHRRQQLYKSAYRTNSSAILDVNHGSACQVVFGGEIRLGKYGPFDEVKGSAAFDANIFAPAANVGPATATTVQAIRFITLRRVSAASPLQRHAAGGRVSADGSNVDAGGLTVCMGNEKSQRFRVLLAPNCRCLRAGFKGVSKLLPVRSDAVRGYRHHKFP